MTDTKAPDKAPDKADAKAKGPETFALDADNPDPDATYIVYTEYGPDVDPATGVAIPHQRKMLREDYAKTDR